MSQTFQIPGRVLYTAGYLAVVDSLKLDAFQDLHTRLGLICFDIRHNPWSRAPIWRKEQMEKALGDAYCHLPAFWNKNYRGQNGEGVQIVDMDRGVQTLIHECAFRQRAPLLLCGCPEYKDCHRSVVAQGFYERGLVDEIVEIGASFWNFRNPNPPPRKKGGKP